MDSAAANASAINWQYNVANSSGSWTFGIRLGVVFMVQISCLSAISVSCLLCYITWQEIKYFREHKKWQTPSPILVYFISLLSSEFVQAASGIISSVWVHHAGVVEGPLCTAQSILNQMGDVGVALGIVSIAVTTWGLIVRNWRSSPSPKIALIVVALIWSFVILVTTISLGVHRNKEDPYYGNTKYWCWIRSPTYWKDGVGLEYAFMWLAGLSNILLYVPVSLKILGTYWNKRRGIAGGGETEIDRETKERESSMNRVAFQMSLYPVIYLITITPLSISRFMEFANPNNPPPFIFTAFSACLFYSSGIFNALLFSLTRPALIPNNPFSHTGNRRTESEYERSRERSFAGRMFGRRERMRRKEWFLETGMTSTEMDGGEEEKGDLGNVRVVEVHVSSVSERDESDETTSTVISANSPLRSLT
ncbi:hypothetical protein SISSUDRAFT_1130654 [Sistotremastrum suecicum HHB10207 ss-3]|uniref:G-protein coupled receptors family 1 profile domain-containing protein n=1 Tax=Sistotremastrum suecicum HHB10207 ss-3 TaxID=1314776 RepID=A0A166B737_9AGAM|nr:hypothetical protein SISSUDRAFT_1130654 [Sistotremastrum suecicum HHB10207 ss-3]